MDHSPNTLEEVEMQEAEKRAVVPAYTVIIGILLCGLMLIFSCQPAHAAQIKNNDAILAIIGEAENQGEIGMLAVACAIRNRGNLRGVYGLQRATHEKYRPVWVWAMASAAWDEAARKDITHGATGWGNAHDGKEFAKCKWWKNCQIVFRYKDHFFYREAV